MVVAHNAQRLVAPHLPLYDGNELDYVSVYPIDSGDDRGKMILEDSPDDLYGMAIQFDNNPDALYNRIVLCVDALTGELLHQGTRGPSF